MKIRNLFILIIILIVIIVFSMASLCNKKVTVDLSGAGKQEDTQEQDNQSPGSDEDMTSQSSGSSSQQSDESSSQQQDQGSDDQDDSEEPAAPTIRLKIIKDATYSSKDDVCFYRIEAEVTGNPKPDVEWSKDDSGHSWGQYIAQVNLKRDEVYTLTATATNSSGSDTDSIELSWGCD